MTNLTIWPNQMRSAPPLVRQWIEGQVRAALGGCDMLQEPAPSSTSIAQQQLLAVGVLVSDELALLSEMIRWWRHQRIRERAYEIWELQGRPDGRSSEHWLQAEAELAAQTAPSAPPGGSLLRTLVSCVDTVIG